MIIEITEEEREFLLRVCSRAKIFSTMNLFKHGLTESAYETDNIKLDSLIDKLKASKDHDH